MNKKMASILCAAALAGGLLSGCMGSASAAEASSMAAQSTALAGSAVEASDAVFASVAVLEQDLESGWDDAAATHITLNDDTASVSGDGAAWQDGVLTVSAGGVYVFSGALDDGQIVVAAPEDDEVRLVLNGMDIASSAGPAIWCSTAARLTLTLAAETYNTVSDLRAEAGADDEEGDVPAAAVYSEASLVLNGTGGLLVNGSHKNGVYTRDDLVLVSGDIEVNAPNNAMRGRDSVTLIDANLELTAGNDGLQSNNDAGADKGWIELFGGSAAITAEHDGIQAESSLRAYGGDYTILTGGGSANAPEREEETFDGPGGMGGGGMGSITPPEDMSFPEGMEMPDGRELPEGMTPPDGMEFPDDMQPPDGVTPPKGTAPSGGAQAQSGAETSASTSQARPESGSADSAAETAQPDSSAATAAAGDTTAQTQESESDSAKGIKAVAGIEISGGSFTIDSADDTLHSNGDLTVSGGEFTLSSGDDAIHADGAVLVDGEPVIDITTCYEGLEGTTVTVRGGDISVIATDDALNAAGGSEATEELGPGMQGAGGDYVINIEGGTLRLTGGTDGLDSNGDINISGGVTVLNMNRLLSGGEGMVDRDGDMTLTGGILAGAGGNGFVMMGQQQTDTSQPALEIYFSETQSAGTLVSIAAADGTPVLSVAPTYEFSCVILSSPELAVGESYTVSTGGSATEEVTAGLYTGPAEGGEELFEITLSDGLNSLSDTGAAMTNTMGGGRGGQGGFGGFNPGGGNTAA